MKNPSKKQNTLKLFSVILSTIVTPVPNKTLHHILKKKITNKIPDIKYSSKHKNGCVLTIVSQTHNSPQNIIVTGMSINDNNEKNNSLANLLSFCHKPESLVTLRVLYLYSKYAVTQNNTAVANECPQIYSIEFDKIVVLSI